MTEVIIQGAAGRMGQALTRCAHRLSDVGVVGATEAEASSQIGLDAGVVAGVGEIGVAITSDLASLCAPGRVVIDFTVHNAVPAAAVTAAENGACLVLGTTGLTDEESAVVHAQAETIPVMWAPNMSLGVNILFAMTRRAASALGDEYDIEIVEMHHRHKTDAPSGTALLLAEKAAAGREVNLDEVAVYGRHGDVGPRPRGQIGVHTVRGGDTVGDHCVRFAAEGETIELSHRASSRDTFAMGALHAAQWIVRMPAGMYDMQDVLGLHE